MNYQAANLDDFPRELILIDGQIPAYHQLIFNVLRSEAPARKSYIQVTPTSDSELAKHIGVEPVVFLVVDVREDFPRIPVNESEVVAQSLEPAYLTPLPH